MVALGINGGTAVSRSSCPARYKVVPTLEWLEHRDLPNVLANPVTGMGLSALSVPGSEEQLSLVDVQAVDYGTEQLASATAAGEAEPSDSDPVTLAASSMPAAEPARAPKQSTTAAIDQGAAFDPLENLLEAEDWTAGAGGVGSPSEPVRHAISRFGPSGGAAATSDGNFGGRVATTDFGFGATPRLDVSHAPRILPSTEMMSELANLAGLPRNPGNKSLPLGSTNGHTGLDTSQVNDLYVPPGYQGPGVSLSDGLTLTEGGASGTVNVALKTQPTSAVTVNLSADATLSLSVTTLNFTPTNWSTPQAVSVAAVTDSVAEGYHVGLIQSSTSSSSDPDYNLINGDTAVVNILDANGPNAVDDEAETTAGTAVSGINVLANDYEPHGYTLTVTGYTQGTGGGTVALNADQSFRYTPAANYVGLDQFTYTIDNGHGQTMTGNVFVHVGWVDRTPVVNSVSTQTNAEDDNVSLQVTGSDPDGDQVYYTATNLPPGLSIDALTGKITGTVSSTAANPDPMRPPALSHTYNVSIQGADSGGLTSTVSFNWTINHTNHAPWVEFPGSVTGTAYHNPNYQPYQMVAHDPDAAPDGPALDTLTFGATGLPDGTTIDSATGLIHGHYLSSQAGVYTPTVTVSDGHTTGSQTFTLTLLPENTSLPAASIWINNTSDTSDDITAVDTPAPTEIVGTPGATVSLTVSGPASLSQNTVTRDTNGQASVTITPTGQSQTVDDITVKAFVTATLPSGGGQQQVEIDAKKLTAEAITFPASINRPYDTYNNLGTGGKTHPLTRIPPRIDTTFEVTLSLDLTGSKQVVTLEASGGGPNNGTFTINGGATATIKKTTKVQLRGGTMTNSGDSAGKLQILATIGTATKGSPFFSVSAIPIKLRLAEVMRNTTPKERNVELQNRDKSKITVPLAPFSVGIEYHLDSDSRNLGDLNKVWFGEFVHQGAVNNPPWQVTQNIPAHDFIRPTDRSAAPVTVGSFFDNFLVEGNLLPKAGTADAFTADQWYGFRDGRSETIDLNDKTHAYQNDIAYFAITRKAFKDTDNLWYYQFTRTDADGVNEPSAGLKLGPLQP